MSSGATSDPAAATSDSSSGSAGDSTATVATSSDGSSGDSGSTGDVSTSGTPPGTTTGQETTGTETGSSGGEMPCETSCVTAAPARWNGPAVRRLVDSLEDGCGGDFPSLALEGFTEFAGPAAMCTCECGAPAGGACDASIDIQIYDAECTATAGSFCTSTENLNDCDTLTNTLSAGNPTLSDTDDDFDFGARFIAEAPSVATAPSCSAASTENIRASSVSGFEVLCEPSEFLPGTCEDRSLCVAEPAAPFEDNFCIWTEGDVECPGGPYTEREVLYDELVDTRACTDCSCGAAQGVGCTGSFTVVAAYSQGAGIAIDPPETFAADATCTNRVTPNGSTIAGATYTLDYDAESPTSSGCEASGGDSTGSADPTGARTVCCTAPR